MGRNPLCCQDFGLARNGKKYDLLPRLWALRGMGRSMICCQDFVSCGQLEEIRFVAKTLVLRGILANPRKPSLKLLGLNPPRGLVGNGQKSALLSRFWSCKEWEEVWPRPWALRGTRRSTICCQDFVSREQLEEIRFVAKTLVLQGMGRSVAKTLGLARNGKKYDVLPRFCVM